MKAQLESLVSQMYRDGMRFEEAVREFQSVFIFTVLREQKGNQCQAAEKLGMHRNTLRRMIRDLQVDLQAIREGTRRPPQSEHLRARHASNVRLRQSEGQVS